ncbi:MAG: T9SS type A sorting domain-containing protein, partial [Bacteroidales bacterium]
LLTQTNSAERETNWDNIQNPNSNFPSKSNTGRVEFAIAPSDQNVVYAMAAKSSPPKRYSLFGIYLSEDGGQNWRIVAPGGSDLLNILGATYFDDDGVAHIYYQGDYNNVISVFPNNPYKILAGGVNLWEGQMTGATGYYQWTEKSVGIATFLPTGIFYPLYCHVDHHTYVFKPGSNSEFMIGTDGGVYSGLSGAAYTFQAKNKSYNVTQFYTLDVSNMPNEVIGGTQDNGTQYIWGQGTTAMKGEDLWRPANLDAKFPEGTDGGYAAMSNIRINRYSGGTLVEAIDPVSFYSKSLLPKNEVLTDRIRRSETLGYDYSANFFSSIASNSLPVDINFLTPMTLWECYDNENSRDSVMVYVNRDYIITYDIDSVYNPDGTLNRVDTIYLEDPLYARSKNYNHPFQFFDYNEYFKDFQPSWIGDTLFHKGDSLKVKDLVSSKLFLATKDEVWMTLGALVFNEAPEWYVISAKNRNGFTGNPSCVAYSADANELFVGTYEGDVYRISNIALAYNEDLADVESANCIIASTLMEFAEGNTQVVTSIAVDPKDANNVIITLGNYGNTDYVYYSSDALSDDPSFNSVQNNLPAMPVYSSLIDFKSNVAYLGTDEGMWMTDNIKAGNVVWNDASAGFGRVPVMVLKQQICYKSQFNISLIDPVTQEVFTENYPAIENYGMVYAATHGRGVFRIDSPALVGIEETPGSSTTIANSKISLYPNPASNDLSVSFDLVSKSDVVMSVYDLSGKLVISNVYGSLSAGQQNLKLNINTLTRGTYIVRMTAGSKSATSKLIIIK